MSQGEELRLHPEWYELNCYHYRQGPSSFPTRNASLSYIFHPQARFTYVKIISSSSEEHTSEVLRIEGSKPGRLWGVVNFSVLVSARNFENIPKDALNRLEKYCLRH